MYNTIQENGILKKHWSLCLLAFFPSSVTSFLSVFCLDCHLESSQRVLNLFHQFIVKEADEKKSNRVSPDI